MNPSVPSPGGAPPSPPPGAGERGGVRRRSGSWAVLAILISGASTWDVSANGFGLPDQDAFATARGEAFVATADNPSAIYYNPAGITRLSGNNFRGGLNSVYYRPSFQPPSGQPNSGKTYDSSDNFAWLPQFFYTYTPSNSPASCGLGVYAPYGGKMNWPQETGFRSVAISGSLKYITINPVVAVKVLPGLSFGGGVMFNYSKLEMNQGLKPYGTRGINYFNFSGDGWSVGYNLGILWQPHPKLSFGATFRSQARMNFQGSTDFQDYPGAYNSPQQHDASAQFDFPLTAVFGVSYRPSPKWNLEFDADYTDWSSFGTVNIEQLSPPPLGPLNRNSIPVNLYWQGSWMYEFGVTRFFDNGWHVSAGYAFNENSVPNTYYTPLAADMDRHFFSVGTGFNGKIYDFDVAYQLGYGPAHTVTGSTSSTAAITGSNGENADGTYHFISHAIFISAGVHF